MSEQMLSVSQLNEYLRMLMDSNPTLTDVWVRGEISNFSNHRQTGHFYFSLKDEKALIRAVMFRSYASRVRFLPENGMKVLLHGRVSMFPRDGQCQIYVDEMQPDGLGSLWLAYEQLRQRLSEEGLFDPERKRPIPKYPLHIGLITSPTGAAVRDMIQILGRRFPAARVTLFPALVQGADAPQSLLSGLFTFASQYPVDLIILGRGGGSAEDLFAFNNEELVRAVAACPIPVISAVGHETDVTLCDLAADLRAPTPSAAAELAVPNAAQLREGLHTVQARLASILAAKISHARAQVSLLASADVLRSPTRYLENQRMTLAFLEKQLAAGITRKTEQARTALAAQCGKLEAMNPLLVLARGYTAVFDNHRHPITRAAHLVPGQGVQIRFADKTADATITRVRESE